MGLLASAADLLNFRSSEESRLAKLWKLKIDAQRLVSRIGATRLGDPPGCQDVRPALSRLVRPFLSAQVLSEL